MSLCAWLSAVGVVLAAAVVRPAHAGEPPPPPDYGIDFVTIGAVGNAPYGGPPGFAQGRGSVPYEYRIGRLEITTAQWMDFVNTFSTQSDELGHFAAPAFWGAGIDAEYDGPGLRWRLRNHPDAAVRPVFGITWREAAMYCNWLHNDRPTDFAAIQDGAYDTSTFTFNPGGTFNDQRTHHPDARFWIPTFDEWIKAAHYDPNRHGEGQEGWWLYSHRSEERPISGAPGEGETSAGFRFSEFGFEHYDIPLGAYPETFSPWGLLDASGGTTEFTEEMFEEIFIGRTTRWAEGEFAGEDITDLSTDRADWGRTMHPNSTAFGGLRIVSAVPGPSCSVLLGITFLVLHRRRRRSC